MDLEIIILSEVNQREKDKYCMISLICGISKKKNNDTNELFYKTETDSQTQKTNLWSPKGKRMERQVKAWNKVFATLMCYERILSRVRKELLKLTIIKQTIPAKNIHAEI